MISWIISYVFALFRHWSNCVSVFCSSFTKDSDYSITSKVWRNSSIRVNATPIFNPFEFESNNMHLFQDWRIQHRKPSMWQPIDSKRKLADFCMLPWVKSRHSWSFGRNALCALPFILPAIWARRHFNYQFQYGKHFGFSIHFGVVLESFSINMYRVGCRSIGKVPLGTLALSHWNAFFPHTSSSSWWPVFALALHAIYLECPWPKIWKVFYIRLMNIRN